MHKYLFVVGKVCSCFVLISIALTVEDTIKETHCEDEVFSPTCNDGEVILMINATFGRMNYGKCIEDNEINRLYENIFTLFRCSINILNYMHKNCSGKRVCLINVTEIKKNYQKVCQMPEHLNTEYKCIKANIDSCSLNVSKTSTIMSKFGGPQCRNLEIASTPTQAIKIIPVFAFENENRTHAGNITDSNNSVIAGVMVTPGGIGGTQFVTNLPSIKIKMLQTLSNWMLNITVHRCQAILPQKHTIITEYTALNVTLKCELTNKSWTLACNENGQWIGKEEECNDNKYNAPRESYIGKYSGIIISSIISVAMVVTVGTTCLILCQVKRRRISKLNRGLGRNKSATEFVYKESEQQNIPHQRFPTTAHQQLEPPKSGHLSELNSRCLAPLAAKNVSHTLDVTDLPYENKMHFHTMTHQLGAPYSSYQHKKSTEYQPFSADCSCFTMRYHHYGNQYVHPNPLYNAYGSRESPYNRGPMQVFAPCCPNPHVSFNPYIGTVPAAERCCAEEVAQIYNTLESFPIPESVELRMLHQPTDPCDRPTDLTMAREKLALSREDIMAAEKTPWEEMK